jgi:lipopolysaccharide transport system permease protein
VWKNLTLLAHNFLILPLVFLVFAKLPNEKIFLLLPAMIVTVTFLSVTVFVLALVTTRFRDIQQILASFMVVVFYVTPVIWQPSLIPGGTAHILLGLNPFYHFLQIIRLPILGQAPTFENWSLSILVTVIMAVSAHLAAGHYKNRLAYWV